MIPHPSGTKIDSLIAKGIEPLPLDDSIPNPGKRFGKAEQYAATLLAMKGDKSFVVKDASTVYVTAKSLGMKITTRAEKKGIRVWRVK